MSEKQFIINIDGNEISVSEELYEFFNKSERKMIYADVDRKREQILIDDERKAVNIIPSREDSLERLTEIGVEFVDTAENIAETITLKVTIEQALDKLNDEERNLIVQLYYFDKSEREVAKELSIPQRTLHDFKQRVLCKLHKLLK